MSVHQLSSMFRNLHNLTRNQHGTVTSMQHFASALGSPLVSNVANSAFGGLLGGLVAATLVIGFTEVLKLMLGVVSRQNTWVLILAPLLGLALSVLVLYGFGLSGGTETLQDAYP